MEANNEQNLSHVVETNSIGSSYQILYEAFSTGVTLPQLKLYIKFPMKYNRQIRKLSREMYSLNGVFTNVVDYYVSAPSLDCLTTCYEHSKKNDKKRIKLNKILDKINHKLTTSDILLSLMLDGMYVGILRNTTKKNKINIEPFMPGTADFLDSLSTNGNLMIQPLNLDYCKFIGFQNNDYVVAYDMSYFDLYKSDGLLAEIKNYPTDFAKAYIDYKKDASKRWHPLNQMTTVCLKFKSNISEPYGRTLAIATLSDMLFSDQYTDSQRATINELASSIYTLTLPEGEKSGSCSLNKEQQRNLVGAFENAVSATTGKESGSAKVSKITLPPGSQIGKLTKDTTLIKDTLNDENIKKVTTGLGMAEGAINGAGKANYSSLQINVELVLTRVFRILERVQWQYNKVFNHLISPNGEYIVKFIYFKTSSLNKKQEFSMAKDMYTLAGGSRLWMYAVGSGDVETYLALMDYEKDMNFDEKYPPHATSYTMSGDENGAGRKESDNPTDKTIATKTNGGNNSPKPSLKL